MVYLKRFLQTLGALSVLVAFLVGVLVLVKVVHFIWGTTGDVVFLIVTLMLFAIADVEIDKWQARKFEKMNRRFKNDMDELDEKFRKKFEGMK